jgi:uncharacterized membrane protein YsdA (DUF1294 family)
MIEPCLIVFGGVSLVTFILYATDKRKAQKGDWRIPEKTLLLFSFFGGALGGLLAMTTVRHKTKKWYFYFINFLGLLWQVGLVLFLVYKTYFAT